MKQKKLYHYDKQGNRHNVTKNDKGDLVADNGKIVNGKITSNPNAPKGSPYDFSKPMFAQNLGDEWDDYAWGADDF